MTGDSAGKTSFSPVEPIWVATESYDFSESLTDDPAISKSRQFVPVEGIKYVYITGKALTFNNPTRNKVSYTLESGLVASPTLIGKPFLDSHRDKSIRHDPPIGKVINLFVSNGKAFYECAVPVIEVNKGVIEQFKVKQIPGVSIQVSVSNVVERDGFLEATIKEFLELSAVIIPGERDSTINLVESYGKFALENHIESKFLASVTSDAVMMEACSSDFKKMVKAIKPKLGEDSAYAIATDTLGPEGKGKGKKEDAEAPSDIVNQFNSLRAQFDHFTASRLSEKFVDVSSVYREHWVHAAENKLHTLCESLDDLKRRRIGKDATGSCVCPGCGYKMDRASSSMKCPKCGADMRLTEDISTGNAGALIAPVLAKKVRKATEPRMVSSETISTPGQPPRPGLVKKTITVMKGGRPFQRIQWVRPKALVGLTGLERRARWKRLNMFVRGFLKRIKAGEKVSPANAKGFAMQLVRSDDSVLKSIGDDLMKIKLGTAPSTDPIAAKKNHDTFMKAFATSLSKSKDKTLAKFGKELSGLIFTKNPSATKASDAVFDNIMYYLKRKPMSMFEPTHKEK